jgi:hypothetical protein
MRNEGSGALLEFLHKKIAGPHTQRHDGERGILAGIGRKAGSVHYVEILDVVGLLELIEH